jgi:alkylhydroperoxidase/carboxymuconolactone decarboxylase family protein YurZ
MDPNEFSEKLMKLSMDIQNASRDKQKAFAKLFSNAKEALEKGFTQEEIQIIVVTAFQVQTNPELKQLWSILMGQFEIDPDDDYQ